MLKLISIAMAGAGTALWCMPLGNYPMPAFNYVMSLNGSAIAEFTSLTYGVPVSLLLFGVFACLTSKWLQLATAILAAICTAVVYVKLGRGYTPAFAALSVIVGLCVVLSLLNVATSKK